MPDKKTALVTGANGFIAYHLIKLLKEEGFKVIGTDKDRPNKRIWGLCDDFITANITSFISVAELFTEAGNIDYVFHTAAIFDYSAPLNLLDGVNIEGTKRLCNAASIAEVKAFVHWSTAEVYGLPKEQPTPESYILNPINKYGKSKVESERVVRDSIRQDKLPAVIIRPTAVYGPASTYGIGAIIIFLGWLKKMHLKIFAKKFPGNPGVMTHLVHVEDVARAALHLAKLREKSKLAFLEYNVAEENPHRLGEILKIACEKAGIGEIGYFTSKKLVKVLIPISKFLSKLYKAGFHKKLSKLPRIPLEEGTVERLYNDTHFDVSRLKNTGFEWLHPDSLRKDGVPAVIEWYKKEKYI